MTPGLIAQMIETVTRVLHDPVQARAVVFALMKDFGGERLYLPHTDYAARNREMKDLYSAGATYDHLAKRYSLSVKTIRRILGA